MKYRAFLFLLLSLFFSGCSADTDPTPGSKGGPCKIGKEPCLEGLSCLDGQCRAAEAPDTLKNVQIEFNISKRRLIADGKDKTPFFISATTDDGEPFDGRLTLYPSPSTAGLIRFIPDEGELPSPGRFVEVEFNDEGTATLEYIACNRMSVGSSDCPEFVFLNVSRPNASNQFEPIARSPVMKLSSNSTADDPTLDASRCNEEGVHIVVRTSKDDTNDAVLSANADLDLATGELSLVGPGLNLTLRAGLGGGMTDSVNISRLDVVLELGESLMVPAPCNDGSALLWSGFFNTESFDVVGKKLKTLKANFELACSADDNQTATIVGCMLIENEVPETTDTTGEQTDMMNDMGGMSGN